MWMRKFYSIKPQGLDMQGLYEFNCIEKTLKKHKSHTKTKTACLRPVYGNAYINTRKS